MRALLVESSAAVDEKWLSANNFVVEAADTGADALDLAKHYDFDIIMLNLQLSDMDGCDLLRRIRANAVRTPMLALSAVSRPEAKVKALRLGADDCVTTPVDPAELLARVHAVIRRSKGFAAPLLQVGPLCLDLSSRQVTVNEEQISLSGKEYAILELLVMRKGTVITKEAFLNHLYGGMDEPEMKIIDVFMCKLRRKLANAGCSEMIGTVWGRGYILRENARAALGTPKPVILNGLADFLVA